MFDSPQFDSIDHTVGSHSSESLILSKGESGVQQLLLTSSTPSALSSPELLHSSASQSSHSSVFSGVGNSPQNLGINTMYPDTESHFDDMSKQAWSLDVEPGIIQNDSFPPTFANGQFDENDHFQMSGAERSMGFIAPNMVQPMDMSFYQTGIDSSFEGLVADFSSQMHPPPFHVPSPVPYESPAASAVSSMGNNMTNQTFSSYNGMSRQPSVGSMESAFSKGSPRSLAAGSDEDSNERRCPYPGCGRVFKDLRAHKLTHQSERPEKCPIEKCQYHIKGFARKYDQTRHTLTHYKGTMVCGFCPGIGSASEKSFNRADVFKRHLTSVHGVEQMAANSRRKAPSASKKSSSKDDNKEGKCSTCGFVFSSAQDFYNHLDDCVMKVLEKPEISESYNQRHMMEVAADEKVKATLERNGLPVEVENEIIPGSDDDDEEMEDDDDDISDSRGHSVSNRSGKSTRGLTRSKGGVPTISKGRRKRKDYPHSWGCGKEQMKMKKRVLCVFDGQRRLWKDEMMMGNEYEVRVPLPGGKNYVTDLDVMSLRRATAIHNATEEEKGPWLKDEEVTKLML